MNQLDLLDFADENNKIQGWESLQDQHHKQVNLFKLLQKQINVVPTKSTLLNNQNCNNKQINRPQTGRQIYSSIGTYESNVNTPTQRILEKKKYKLFMAQRQKEKKQNRKEPSQYYQQLQKKYNSIHLKRKEDQKNLLDMKKQSLIFNINHLKPKNFVENAKNFHDLEKKSKYKSTNLKKQEDKLKLLIVIKKNKQNQVVLKPKNSSKNLQIIKKNYEPLSIKNKKKLVLENQLFSDFHLSKKEKLSRNFQRLG